MNRYSLSHLSNRELLQDLAALVARDRATTAELLAHIAEVDERKLYLPAAHPSMYSYCVHELGLSEQSALKRIRAARTARQFPVIFDAVAQGRLNLSAVVLLTPYLTPENVDELLEAAANQSKSELERLLARRGTLAGLAVTPAPAPQLSPGTVETHSAVATRETVTGAEATGLLPALTPPVPACPRHHFTVEHDLYEKLQYARSLLGHQLPSGDMVQVLERAIDDLIARLEKRKFAATDKPRAPRRRTSANKRHVPAEVKRAVWKRDGGRCTFVGDAGRRCPCRTRLEFDHIDPVARGGEATVDRMRLRCRAHNQYTAECTYGAGFMERKRQEAGRATPQLSPGTVETHLRAMGRTPLSARTVDVTGPPANDVIPWLRQLGFRADEARSAAARCEAIPDATLEERVRFALSLLAPRHRVLTPA
jgi:hypothetical protein